MVGFVDLGSVDQDMEQLVLEGDHSAVSKSDESTKSLLADQVIVFMARGRAIFKPSLNMPVAHYYSNNLKGIVIVPIF